MVDHVHNIVCPGKNNQAPLSFPDILSSKEEVYLQFILLQVCLKSSNIGSLCVLTKGRKPWMETGVRRILPMAHLSKEITTTSRSLTQETEIIRCRNRHRSLLSRHRQLLGNKQLNHYCLRLPKLLLQLVQLLRLRGVRRSHEELAFESSFYSR